VASFSKFTAPWCVAVHVTTQFCALFLGPTAHLIPYHYVVQGELHAVVKGGEPQRLSSGELVLFPRNDEHLLGSDPSLPPVIAADIIVPSSRGELASIHHGGGGTPTRMICGSLAATASKATRS
jgi:hypothetical protein